MKQPTRVVRTSGIAPATRVVRVTRHAEKYPSPGQRRFRRIRRLLVLIALVAGIWWTVQQLNGSGGAAATNWFRRALGVGTTVPNGVGGSDSPTQAAPAVTEPRGAVVSATPTQVSEVQVSPTSQPSAANRPTATARVVTGAHITTAAPTLVVKALPASALLQNDYQIYETWNNCGPASLSMALSYFGINESQAVLGQALRPYENTTGDNDDKDVTMQELAAEARTFGLLAYYRPHGTMQMIKRFIALGAPVIAETLMTTDDDIGHYRVIKGYDNSSLSLIQDDSMQGHNVRFTYADFNAMWRQYNYQYLVLAPKNKKLQAEAILGRDLDPKTAWRETAATDRAMLIANPSDIDSRFNLSIALYYLGDYQQSVNEFEQVRSQLPARTLWYQIEPLEAYYALGDYQQVISLADDTLNNGDRAFSQLYILLGDIDRKQGNLQAAKTEFQNAVFYNINLKAARVALGSLS
jgi:predicted double-glycine peptidase